jgi:hypothetical protein
MRRVAARMYMHTFRRASASAFLAPSPFAPDIVSHPSSKSAQCDGDRWLSFYLEIATNHFT